MRQSKMKATTNNSKATTMRTIDEKHETNNSEGSSDLSVCTRKISNVNSFKESNRKNMNELPRCIDSFFFIYNTLDQNRQDLFWTYITTEEDPPENDFGMQTVILCYRQLSEEERNQLQARQARQAHQGMGHPARLELFLYFHGTFDEDSRNEFSNYIRNGVAPSASIFTAAWVAKNFYERLSNQEKADIENMVRNENPPHNDENTDELVEQINVGTPPSLSSLSTSPGRGTTTENAGGDDTTESMTVSGA
mmetsp:Transcript_25104/g.38109  ORF Transcript_25104/g.38109 Transcript_25104/m.38109 type:complete len:251 (+) Transcript_25104:1586-2338(+)